MGFLRLQLHCLATAFVFLYTSGERLLPGLRERFGCAGTRKSHRTDRGVHEPVGVAGSSVAAVHHEVTRSALAAAQTWRDAAACRRWWKVNHPRWRWGSGTLSPMNALDLLKGAVREAVVPVLRREGYRGSFPTWRLTAPTGDVAVVNLQSSQWNSREQAQVFVNIAVVPEVWWKWLRECDPWPGGPAKQPMEYHGLFRDRLHRVPGRALDTSRQVWTVTSADSAQAMARNLATVLERDGLPVLRRYLNRAALLSDLRSDRLVTWRDGAAQRDQALAVLLSDEGGPELEEVCERLDAFDGAVGMREVSRRTASWARSRAQR